MEGRDERRVGLEERLAAGEDDEVDAAGAGAGDLGGEVLGREADRALLSEVGVAEGGAVVALRRVALAVGLVAGPHVAADEAHEDGRAAGPGAFALEVRQRLLTAYRLRPRGRALGRPARPASSTGSSYPPVGFGLGVALGAEDRGRVVQLAVAPGWRSVRSPW